MAQLGYTWYPQDWWTSETFKRLKRFPMVRYALRELFDLMYKEGEPVEMNRDFIYEDFNIELSDDDYTKLLDYIDVQEDGRWWIGSIDIKNVTSGRLSETDYFEWRRLREIVFSRDNHTCQYCGSNKHLELDHIIPFSISRDDNISNLTTACRLCNRRKRDKSVDEYYDWLIQKNIPTNKFKIPKNG